MTAHLERCEAIAAAKRARFELARDGPAPTVSEILREMGRGPCGYLVDDGPAELLSATEAARRALRGGSR